ncbi:MAG TPA: hypothetical protein VKY85_07290 [Candidatus Angelobacter sp.]|nr:hypothetical protein [Candidatus Angelobacter sp.]
MAVLSILADNIMLGCASPVYLLSQMDYRRGAKIMFEVAEEDASHLKTLIGQMETYGFDPRQRPFIAQLTSLEPCNAQDPALALLGKPTMRGILTVQGPADFGPQA